MPSSPSHRPRDRRCASRNWESVDEKPIRPRVSQRSAWEGRKLSTNRGEIYAARSRSVKDPCPVKARKSVTMTVTDRQRLYPRRQSETEDLWPGFLSSGILAPGKTTCSILVSHAERGVDYFRVDRLQWNLHSCSLTLSLSLSLSLSFSCSLAFDLRDSRMNRVENNSPRLT